MPFVNFRKHPIRAILFSLLLLLALIVALSSYVVKFAVTHWFEQQGAEITIEELDLSLFNSRLHIKQFNSSQQQQTLSFDDLVLDWRWSPLFENQVVIDEFELQGLTLDLVTQQKVVQQIGSIVPPAPSNDTPPDESATPAEWKINLTNLELGLKAVCWKDSDAIKPMFEALVHPDAPANQLCLKTQLQWLGDVKIIAGQQVDYSVEGKFLSSLFDLQLNQMSLLSHQQLILDQLRLTPEAIKLDQIDWQQPYFMWDKQAQSPHSMAKLAGSIDELALKNLSFAPDTTTVELNEFISNNIKTWATAKDQQLHPLASLSSIVVKNVFHQPTSSKVEALELSEFKALDQSVVSLEPQADENYHAGFANLTINHIDWQNNTLVIDEVLNKGTFLYAEILPDAQFNLAQWFPASEASDESAASTEAEAEMKPEAETQEETSVHYTIKQLSIIDSQTLQVIDHSVHPVSKHQLEKLNLTVKDLNSEQRVSDFTFETLINQTGILKADGQLTQTAKSPDVVVKGNLSGLNLAAYSPYAAKFIGYRIDQGQLNTDIDFNLKSDQLDSEVNFSFNKFELGDLEQHEKNELTAELGVPLPLALNLLRDSDDNIELSIPLKGDVNNPDFSINDVITTVSIKAIKTAVIYQYSPFGLLTLAGGVLDLATGLSFDPVPYAAQSKDLNDTAKQQLDKLAPLLNEKPKITLVLCGQAGRDDLPPPAQPVAEGAKLPPLTKEEIKLLTNLADQRQKSAVQYLTATHKIAAQRLLACNVKIDSTGTAKPSVTISI
ncbi:DUF748 domain-containing protein [Pleionea sp. CnH1-48]|uniref:DUF748 domain-containing protein n=1 Tax=Pleionea sp. CnH1-48 TaxID=2954494 RepID=UPI002096CA74|nr:DUF748 domain-containing protein [Pleionea sp. CnH1-48]MCO7225321.1 DUF748 domain-containing protein [Pleionea sp. CnH1-48]